MSFDPMTAVFDLGKTAIERLFPDPLKRAEEMRKLEELKQQGNLDYMNAHVKLMLAQADINKTEATHKSLFVAGWRPAVGWVGAISLGVLYIPKAILMTCVWAYQTVLMIHATADMSYFTLPPFPDLGVSDLIGLLMSMLGIGVMRSIDKYNKVETNNIGDK